MTLKAPFPYTGGKSMIADTVWEALGDVTTYVEPFAGSCAVLLARPQPFAGLEIVNDANGYVANFWRAVQQSPDEVAKHADHPCLENDLHARHRWLSERRDQLQQALEDDPEWCDPKIAGWWVWGMSNYFNGAWCVRKKLYRCKPMTRPTGVCVSSADPYQWMGELQDRLRRVRVLCGDYTRALTPSVVRNYESQTNVTGVFLDPPYDGGDQRVYGEDVDGKRIFQDAMDWAITNASPKVRVVLAGYDSRPMPEGWREVSWEGNGGHGRRRSHEANTNSNRERLWLSPSCIQPATDNPASIDDLFGF